VIYEAELVANVLGAIVAAAASWIVFRRKR